MSDETKKTMDLEAETLHCIATQSAESIEQHVDELTRDLYQHSGRTFTPMYPWVFVRVLKKEQLRNGLWLPDIDQNKTVHEGVVLATWEPLYREKMLELTAVQRRYINSLCTILGDSHAKISPETIESDLGMLNYRREITSQLIPGQHVLFPHWAGIPIEGFKDKRYRVVKETDWEWSKDGGIFATVDYEGTSTRDELRKILKPWCGADFQMPTRVEEHLNALIEKIEHRFMLVDRDKASVTLSGR